MAQVKIYYEPEMQLLTVFWQPPRKNQIATELGDGVILIKDETTGEWMVAKLFFDPETGEAELAEKIPAGPGRDFAIEKFKIVAVQERIVG